MQKKKKKSSYFELTTWCS